MAEVLNTMDNEKLIKHLQTRIINKHADIKYLVNKLVRLRNEIDNVLEQFDKDRAKGRKD